MSDCQNRQRLFRSIFAAAAWLMALSNGLCLGQIKLATDRPQPHSPEESIRLMRVPKGFRVETAASEPLLADPTDMAFDAQGRIFVCELHGYNLEGYYDILELNKTGVLDTKVRRIDANPEAQRRAAAGQYGTVKMLEDTDGDGRFDRVTVWADHLPCCYGVAPALDGVVVVCPPDIIYLGDADGDGKPEIRQKLGQTGGGPMWNRPSAPRWNIDNWYYHGGGSRFQLVTRVVEPATGTGQFGQTTTDWGDRFFIVQMQPVRYVVPLPHHYLARNPYHGARADTQSLLTYLDVYPISKPDPWRQKRGADPAWLKFYGVAEATPNGYITSACGPLIYRGTLFPPEYRGNHFCCENAQNFIHRCLLERDGAGFRVRRQPDPKTEFLASTEEWFRPINLSLGPDGAMYIVDMYREIIEDYSAIPRFLQQQYVESLIAGHDKGRIYRLTVEGTPKWRPFNLRKAPAVELVGQLSNDNPWWRETAQRLLVERGDRSALVPLRALVREGKTPQARLHALCTLDGLKALEPALVEQALGDSHFGVRTHAVRLAGPWLDQSRSLLEKALSLVDDPDAKVRLQLALTLGDSKDPAALKALGQLAIAHADEPWMNDAILSSVAITADRLLAMLVTRASGPGKGQRLLAPLASIVGARHNDEQIGRLLVAIAAANAQEASGLQAECLKGLIEGLQRGKAQVLFSTTGQQALRQLLASGSETAKLAVRVAGLVKLAQSKEMAALLATAAQTAVNDKAALKERQAAIAVLAAAPFSQLSSTAGKLLDARQPLEVQLAAVQAMASAGEPEVASVLLAGWASHTPKVQAAVLDAVFARQNRLAGLLDAVEKGKVPASSLDANRCKQLQEVGDVTIRARAQALLAKMGPSPSRASVLQRYQAALSLTGHEARGKKVFDQHCANCHKVNGQGYEVGPDLSVTKTRADEALIGDILDPSSVLTVNYRNYTVVTQDGRIFNGVLAAETATSITLRKDQAVEQTILRKDIEEMAASAISMMPEDLEKLVTPQDVADLLAFLRKAFSPALLLTRDPVVVLFEDDPTILAKLTEGAGKGEIRSDNPFSGTAYLAIQPLQRAAARIEGWGFRITEHPGPGEFRYLRFAWKSKGEGIMLELAADGKWPAASETLRRYYSGKNTSGWAAVMVAPQPPRDWTVVTCDLWKDFGSFLLTGMAPTAMGGEALFDRILLLRSLEEPKPNNQNKSTRANK
jgi:putative heme-binding domain-containing protein